MSRFQQLSSCKENHEFEGLKIDHERRSLNMNRVLSLVFAFLLTSLVMVSGGLAYYKPCLITYDVTIDGVDVPSVPQVAAGASFTVSFSYRLWSAEEGPGYVWCAVVGIDEDAQTTFYSGIPGVYPGESGTWAGTLTAPSTPGPYGIYILMEPTVNCLDAYNHYENDWIYNWGAIGAIYVQPSSATEGTTLGKVKSLFE